MGVGEWSQSTLILSSEQKSGKGEGGRWPGAQSGIRGEGMKGGGGGGQGRISASGPGLGRSEGGLFRKQDPGDSPPAVPESPAFI